MCTPASDRLFRTTAVLFDEKASDQKYKNRIVYVVAHELAHQWFGNLVTMDWWSGTYAGGTDSASQLARLVDSDGKARMTPFH